MQEAAAHLDVDDALRTVRSAHPSVIDSLAACAQDMVWTQSCPRRVVTVPGSCWVHGPRARFARIAYALRTAQQAAFKLALSVARRSPSAWQALACPHDFTRLSTQDKTSDQGTDPSPAMVGGAADIWLGRCGLREVPQCLEAGAEPGG